MPDKDDDNGDGGSGGGGGGGNDLRRNMVSTATLGIQSMCIVLCLSSAILDNMSPFFTCEN